MNLREHYHRISNINILPVLHKPNNDVQGHTGNQIFLCMCHDLEWENTRICRCAP